MKRKAGIKVFIIEMILLCLLLCGCKQEKVSKDDQLTKDINGIQTIDDVNLTDIVENLNMDWKDNSLDLYSATNNYELKISSPPDALNGGGASLFIGNSCGFYFKKHLFEDYEQNWDEISYVTSGGLSVLNPIENNTQVWSMGTVVGTDDCLMETIIWQEEGDYVKHHVIVVDKEMKQKQDIHLAFLDGEEYVILSEMMMDTNGNLHFVYEDDVKHYIITDSLGLILNDYQLQGNREHLFVTADGRVTIKTEELLEKGTITRYRFQYYDSVSQKMVGLTEFEVEYGLFIKEAICLDASTVLFADDRGIFRCSPQNVQGATILYKWENHGLSVSEIWDMQCLEGDRISLICKDSNKMYYLNLESTDEEIPIQKIVFAVPSYRKAAYEKAAVMFNKKYPAYHIELKTDYEQTVLLTELMAGKGPVLIDTHLIGFENQKELWLPLDKILEKLELADQLLLPAMELGNIDGQLYGIVRDFSIGTVITSGDKARNWKYEELTKEMLENQILKAPTDSISCDGGWEFVSEFLIHGLEDNYFIDIETGTTHFKKPQMKEMLETIKEYYGGKENYKPGQLLDEGKVLCNPVSISRPEQLALYRMYYGEKLQYSGYPTKNGGKHFLSSSQPITIRKNASKEEITLACLFFQMLLSYDVQAEAITNDRLSFSVRKDVLEKQLAAVNEDTYASAPGIEQIQLGDGVDNTKDRETFYYLLDNAMPQKYLPKELNGIFMEELNQYFNGEMTVDMVLEHLENRVQLYLEEK